MYSGYGGNQASTYLAQRISSASAEELKKPLGDAVAAAVEGVPGATLEATRATDLDRIEELGIDMDHIHSTLQKDGVAAFSNSLDSLLAHLEEKRKTVTRAG